MPSFPFRLPLGKDVIPPFVACRAGIDGVLLDPATDDPIGPNAAFNNDTDPISMEGQRGIGILFKASQAAQVQLFAAEVVNNVVKDIYPIKDTSGANIIQTLAAGKNVCVFYPDLLAEYVVCRGSNDSASNNIIYLRVY